MFANPGSTEVPFLVNLPRDLGFVLALHEASVVGIATGFAIGRAEPAIALLHTTAGLGNAVGALATARVNRAPLVVLVGQQDRRHLAHEPFLTGRLQGLAGDYPVWVDQPVRPQDLPGAISRACHEAVSGKGPAVVIAPMDDWAAPAEDAANQAAAGSLLRAAAADPAAIDVLVAMLGEAQRPAIVVGTGADDAATWASLVEIAEAMDAPVWQESFGARAGFPHDHPRFAGHLPSDRARLRSTLEPLRRRRSSSERRLSGSTRMPRAPVPDGDAGRGGDRRSGGGSPQRGGARNPRSGRRSMRRAGSEIAETRGRGRGAVCAPSRSRPSLVTTHCARGTSSMRSPSAFGADAVVIEETPSSRPEMLARLPAREPLGWVSPAMGGLGFAFPAAIGLRMALPGRPVVAVVGDGSSLYSIQALWSAVHYRVGALFVVLANGGYAVMDRLAEKEGGSPRWPQFPEIDFSALARAFGCPARRIATPDDLQRAFDEVVRDLGDREEPLLLEIAVAPDETFEP